MTKYKTIKAERDQLWDMRAELKAELCLLCDELADLAGLPREPAPGWANCLAKIQEERQVRRAFIQSIASLIKDGEIDPKDPKEDLFDMPGDHAYDFLLTFIIEARSQVKTWT